MKHRALFLFIFVLHFAFTSLAQVESPEAIRSFEKFALERMKAERIPGLSIGFIKSGNVWVKGYGYADLENRVPAKPESAYRLASITKPMTAIAILQLVEQGKIDLNAEVQKYVPYFPKKKHPVKVGQLLGHIGGISHYQNYDLEGHFKYHKNTREAIRVFEKFDLVNEPGTRYRYTSYGYNLLGAVIEGASGKSYGEYMNENIWKPLGMTSTRLDNPNTIIANRVRGYRSLNGNVSNSEFVDISSRFAAGGTRSTVVDLLKFADGMIKGKLLKTSTREKMWTSMTLRNGRYTYYGMGWGTQTGNGHFRVGHSGSQAETRTILYVFPKLDLAIAAAINYEDSNPAVFAQRLFELVSGDPWRPLMYAREREDRVSLMAARFSFLYGIQHFERYGRAMTEDPGELRKSFAAFNKSLKLPESDARRAITDGQNPSGNLVNLKMASYVASKLKSNSTPGEFKKYFRKGAIDFYADYVDWYKKNPSHPLEYRFDPGFEERLARWKNDWSKTWNAGPGEFEFNADYDFENEGKRLGKLYAGSSVYPNHISAVENVIQQVARSGNFSKAYKAANFNYGLYPDSHITNRTLGIFYVVMGEAEKGDSLLRESNKISPSGGAPADLLNSVAYDLGRAGYGKEGLRVLKAAIKIHPKVANLYDSVGDFYRRMKRNKESIEYYSKALEVDPNYPNAAEAKKILEQLKGIEH